MNIFKLLGATIIAALFVLPLSAQNKRMVKGAVQDADGNPIQSATITINGLKESFPVNQDGTFELQIPYGFINITAVAEGYVSQQLEIDGSYLFFSLKVDKDYQARIAAEAAAAALAAQREADAKARAEKKEAGRAETARKDEEYSSRFKNKGIAHSIDFSYAYGLNSGYIVYNYSGRRPYGDLSPMQLTYTFSYKFNRWCSLGIGAGALFNAKSITIENDSFYGNPDFKEVRVDVPVYLNFRAYFLRSAFRPFISLDGGYYILSGTFMADAGIGCEFRLNRTMGIRLQAMASLVPWPDFSRTPAAYTTIIAPGIKLGFDF